MLVVIGTVTDEGVECPAIRGDDGELYTVTRLPEAIAVGDRVKISGAAQRISTCQQGITVRWHSIARIDAGGREIRQWLPE